jgi:hypothetical protein
MNLSSGQAASQQRGDIKTSGAGGTLGGAANSGPAPLQWSRELAEEVMDQMAESIVDLAHKLEESEARVAVLEEEQKILRAEAIVEELDNERLGGRIEEWRECAEKLADALRLCDESVLSRHPASRASEVIVQAWNEFLRMRQEFAGVIEGGQRHCDSEAYATPSDLSPRTTFSDEELREEVRQTVNFFRTFNRWRRGDETLERPCPRVVGEMIDAACDRIERMQREIESLRDALCADKCRDKAAADGGWGNI